MGSFWVKAAALTSLILTGATHAFACTCGFSGFPGETPWEIAKRRSQANFIFEATVERLDLRWTILDAKEGDLIPTYRPSTNLDLGPHTVVTFIVNRAYRGDVGSQVQVKTGLGGGDCGARFVPGVKYLVYLNASNPNDFATSMCSPGGWIEGNDIASDLRYLRGEPPLKSDLARLLRESAKSPRELVVEKSLRARDFERRKQLLSKMTGRICGTIQWERPPKDSYYGGISFLSTKGYLPGEIPYASVNADGSFCSEPLFPGKYYVRHSSMRDDRLVTSLYYPGVSDHEKATPIEVKAEETHSGVDFRVTPQETFSVRGFLFANDVQKSDGEGVSVVLYRVNGNPRIDTHSTFVRGIAKFGYFSIQNVLPGRYTVYISGPGAGWFSKKKETVVDKHSKFIWVELIHKKE